MHELLRFIGLNLDCVHYQMEVILRLLISYLVKHDLRLDIHLSGLTRKQALQSLKHPQNVQRRHATILIMIAQCEHKLDLRVLLDA